MFYLPFGVSRITPGYPFLPASPNHDPATNTTTRTRPDKRPPEDPRPSAVDASAEPASPKDLLPGEGFLLQAARPRDALLTPGRLGREEPGVGLEPHPPQVETVGIPAHPDGPITAE